MKFWQLVAIFGLLIPSWGFAQDIIIIGNDKFAKDSISKKELRDIYLGERTSWAGMVVRPATLSSTEGNDFYEKVLGTSRREFSTGWVKRELTGAGSAPISRDSIDELMDFVGATKGGIGYMPKSAAQRKEGKSIKELALTD